jgi:hypothetical protein
MTITTQLTCAGCQYPLRPVGDGFVIDLAFDAVDRIRPEMWGLPRLDGVIYCPPNPYALNHTGHVPRERRCGMSDFHNFDLSVPGHTCVVSYNAGSKSRTLTCDPCGFVATVPLGRAAAKQERDAWQAHLDQTSTTSDGGTR